MKNITHIRIIEDLVSEIISSYENMHGKPISLPIPVIDIAEEIFHLRIDTEILKGKNDFTSGVIIPEKRWIILNKQMAETRFNFTAAHELGHWLIDSKTLKLRDNQNFLSYPLASQSPIVQEVLANYFASALLMPKTLLVNEAYRYKGFGNLQLMSLSSKFGVSINAMAIRLRDLRDELQNTDVPIRLYEALEYSEIKKLTNKQWKYTIVNIDYSIVDHNLHRKLKALKEQSNYLYVIWPIEKTDCIETLLEFQYIDGFVCTNDNLGNNIGHLLASDPNIRFLDIRNGLWFEHLDETEKKVNNEALIFFPRSNERFTYSQRELLDINRFIETPVKLNHREETKKFIEAAKALNKKVVIVTGCFDLITNAHVRFLKRAKAAGDILVVGIEDDNRVRAFKGRFRPVNTIGQRVELMEAFEFVDFTFVISGSPKLELKRFYTNLHSALKADVLAISEGDPHLQDRKEEIGAGGGTLAIVSQIEEGSTTSLLRQFLAETEFSDIVYISRFKLKNYISNNDPDWRQLVLPLDLKSKT